MLRSPSLDASPVAIRPAVGGDSARIQALVRGLTPATRYLRFFSGMQELAQRWLERFSRADPEGDFTLLALARDSGAAVGMAQYSADPYPSRADFAVLVADSWQGMGIGRQLICKLAEVAAKAGFERIEGEVLAENRPMLHLLHSMGFRLRRDRDSAVFQHASLPVADFTCNTRPLALKRARHGTSREFFLRPRQ
jgi:acetyltransferase